MTAPERKLADFAPIMSTSSVPTSVPPETAGERFPRWLLYSLLTIVLWGLWGAISKIISDHISAYTNQVYFTFGLFPLMLLVLRSGKLAGGHNRRRGIWWAFITGILGGTGNIAFIKSLALGGEASIVVPTTALFPLVTVLLAAFTLHERMSSSQKLGLVLALAAIYMLST